MSLLGSNSEVAQNKIILLYIIEKLNLPVSNLQMVKIVLENRFMNYFFLQHFLNDLCENKLLEYNQDEDKTFYHLTQTGKQTLDYFLHLIPVGIKARIDNTISSIRKNIKNETLITADFTPVNENEFVVSCKVHEDNFSLIELEITVGSRNDARNICDNWKKYPQLIYQEIINCIIKDRG